MGVGNAVPGDDPIVAAALLLIARGVPDVERVLLAKHVPDRYGCCVGCRTQTRSERWPCAQHAIAAQITRLRPGNR
jgi:hypothetical protein